MSLRSATLRPDEIVAADGALQVAPFEPAIRTHFALRFGTQDEEAGAVARKESVQAAFNSPFWPFVLASTSVGQEGLDFHTWCHSVIHWNLPSNPVDMEQREGRVHRYKGYAVRKNVAKRHGAEAVRHAIGSRCDPWNALFDLAVKSRDEGSNDLIPYWIYEIDGGAQIERTVMTLPLSRDEARYRRLKRSLALYRMVFAQPRQEDLLACLEQAIGEDGAAQATERWRISLRPMTPDTTTVEARLAVGIFGIGATARRFVDELKATSKGRQSTRSQMDSGREWVPPVWMQTGETSPLSSGTPGEMSDLDPVRHSLQSLRNVGCFVVSFVVGSQRLEPGAAYHAQEVRALSDVQIELAADNFEPVTSPIICAVAASPGVQGMVGIAPGDIRSALADSDDVRSGIGHGTGANRATQAAIRALNSAFVLPDLLTKAKGVIVVVGGSKTLQLAEICAVTDIVREFAGVDTHVYPAAYHDEHLEDTLRVTLLCAFP
ncbi:conserved hypothetical protein [Ricinus communis]|uniref:Helicase C-terminal domain-containing protein n=1 Tax=Ricinus communis TaxID=3988 RepID=B9TCZ5_RICCO|nr:conserved hypothetical protein [Ricinus communis]